jgi:alkylhydroperoxidase/carboxymuconolactone decarboxylase family protein YurZ
MWTKQARQAGVSDDEIVEAMLVARLMKMATVTDTVSAALAWFKATPQA